MGDKDKQLNNRETVSGNINFNRSYAPATNYTVTNLNYSGASAADAGDIVATPAWGWQAWASTLWARLMADPAIAFALTVFMTHRLLLFAIGAFLAPIAPIDPPLGISLLRDVDPRHWGPAFFLLGPWQRWDTNWYIHIAHFGYAVGDGTTNFPPLFPAGVGVLGRLLLDQYMLAALLISNFAYIVALVYFYRLTKRLFNEETSRRAILFVATFPTAFFLASGYTESLYLALVLAAFYYGEDRRWYIAAGLSALASITRLQGVVLVVPLAFMYMQQRQFNWRKVGRDGLALALSPATFAIYLVYVYFILGDFNFSNHLQVVWHIKFALPWESFFGGLFGLFDLNYSRNLVYNVLDLILLTLFICLIIIWAQRRLPTAYLLYSVLSVSVFLTREGTDGFFWMSMNRYLLSVFPVFMLAGRIMPRYVLKISAVIQAIWVVLFVFWMWAG
ncbi:MAG TPA: mannosyltransferase family protein [Chloroflexia bacterium]|nr:mannosyltransferase family protein [Chloroflexia bacterium]